MTDEQTEILIRSQKELDKLLDDNYNTLDKVAVIDKNLKLDSSKKAYWTKSKPIAKIATATFKHAINCKNIDAGSMNVESSSKITAHDITARKINSNYIYAHNLNCKYLKARTVTAHSTTAGRIYSNSAWIQNIPTLFWSYDYWDTKKQINR